jgi:hypothetical protein
LPHGQWSCRYFSLSVIILITTTPHFGDCATNLPITTKQASQSNTGSDYHDLSLWWKGSCLPELQKWPATALSTAMPNQALLHKFICNVLNTTFFRTPWNSNSGNF